MDELSLIYCTRAALDAARQPDRNPNWTSPQTAAPGTKYLSQPVEPALNATQPFCALQKWRQERDTDAAYAQNNASRKQILTTNLLYHATMSWYLSLTAPGRGTFPPYLGFIIGFFWATPYIPKHSRYLAGRAVYVRSSKSLDNVQSSLQPLHLASTLSFLFPSWCSPVQCGHGGYSIIAT